MKKENIIRLNPQLWLIVAVLSTLSIGTFGQSYQNISEIARHKIDSTYSALIKKNKIVGASIAIIDNGEIVYSKGYGFADKKTQKPATDKTIYRVGSVTKSFTALSVLQLYQKSVLDINQPLSKYLTDFSIKSPLTGEKQDMKINDILSHTSGMPCDVINGFFIPDPMNQKWTISQLNRQYTIAPSGFLMAYSNVGYSLLGEMVARTSGLPYEDYLAENIFKPLNMTSSGIYMNHMDFPEYSMGYVNGKAYKEPILRDAPAGLIHSNVLDMSNYIIMYLNNGRFNDNQILNESLIKEVQKNRLSDITLNTGLKMGYGLFIKDFYVKNKERKDSTLCKYIGHGGDTYAYHANFGFIPDLGIGAVILTNTDKGLKITSVSSLLKVYLEYEKNEELIAAWSTEHKQSSTPIYHGSATEGVYSSLYGPIKIHNENKIKAPLGIAKIVLKKDAQDSLYTGKTWLFGFIPIKMKNQEFYFEEVNNTMYLKSRVPSKTNGNFVAKKVSTQSISPSWKEAVGKYRFTGEKFELPEEYPYHITDAKAKIKIKNNHLVFSYKTSVPTFRASFSLEIINDKNAKSPTYARNTGYTVSLLDDDKIYFCGFTLEKIK